MKFICLRVWFGLDACGSPHYWARELGHDMRLMAPQCVAPYRKNDWHDENDAEAICEVVGRPLLRFVPMKEVGSRRCRKRGLAWPFPGLILLRQPTPKVCPASLSLDRTAPRR